MKLGARVREDAIGAWYHVQDSPDVTVRILREGHVGNEAARMVFLEEVRRIRGLEHAALIRVLELDATGARPWMRTESVAGPTLCDWISERGPLSLDAARALCLATVSAFAYLAERRQIHAVPTPSHLVRVGEVWKLTTFRDIRARDELRGLKGKPHPEPAFSPPERAAAHAADYGPEGHHAWYAGALLRFALGGGTPLDPAERTPADARRMVAWLTDPSPGGRPQGIPKLRRAIQGGDATTATGRPSSPPAAPVLTRKRRRR